jgi:hypothetical protein
LPITTAKTLSKMTLNAVPVRNGRIADIARLAPEE